jgi:hypothetical protein
MSIININDSLLSQLEEDGKRIYKRNPTFASIATFMEHPVSRDFFEKYMMNKRELESMLFLLSLYYRIDSYIGEDKETLNAYHKLSILNKMIRDSDLRPQLVQQYQSTNLIKES